MRGKTKEIAAASVHEIRKELEILDKKEILEICLRLARAKVENKELITYLLFHAGNESLYINSVKHEMEQQLKEMNQSNFYLAKKTIRKVLRTANKHIRFSGIKETEIEIRIHFCRIIKETGISITRHPVLQNLYENQLKKINSVIAKVHEDLRYDYENEIQEILLDKR